MELTEGTIVADRFRLERLLGAGGFGAVWLARHLSLDIPCAIKFLLPDVAGEAEIRARFEREAKVAAQLRSPNVVQILDHGVWQDAPFIVMELLEGEDLEARLARVGRLDARHAAIVMDQVARAMGKAHAAGLVHRDLKPANIFLAQYDDREIVKVLDFGIAKQMRFDAGDARTKSGAVFGSPHFMSPEQTKGTRDVDHRTDLWALGVIAFRCVVGRLPFDSDVLATLFMQILVEPIPVPSQVAGPGGVPPGFDAWWARAVARNPADRFQSAMEMSDALALALGFAVTTGGGPLPPVASISTPTPAPPPDRDTVPAPEKTQGPSLWQTGVSAEVRAGATKKRAGGRVAVAIAAVAGVAALTTAGWFGLHHDGGGQAERGEASAAPAAAASTGSTASPPAATPSANAGDSPMADPDVAPPPSVTSEPAAPRANATKAAAARRAARPPAGGCDPPYRIDAKGHRIVKPECNR